MAEEHDRKILKPCPFCQSDNIQAFDIGRTFVLYCYECCSSGPEGKTLEDAIEKWNRRV
ncbi:MAG: Lar family restriction alleviation protein [Candidatus Methanomethylophilaceae archaeon]|nr:Lar family restriction alleviation protein [Candidatus Methanomethylophilaceae archaeon]